MNQSDMHLLDLPNEMLIAVLRKLNNIDVLHSLLGITNYRLHTLSKANVFTNTLNFVTTTSSTDVCCSIDESVLNRFCIDILPRISHNVKCFILEPLSMERILLATTYSNLTTLKLFNFGQEILLHYFTDDSVIGHILKQQITNLVLTNNDNYNMITSLKTYTTDVYAHILTFFEHLKCLTIAVSSVNDYPPLSLCDVPPTLFSSSILTQLCINVSSFDDCLSLLDGRLKQLSTLIVRIPYITDFSSIVENTGDLPTLKCFSLTCCDITIEYDNRVIPLLRRMSCLEKLTLYLRVRNRGTFIDGTHLYNDILIYMPRLHSFIFYISTVNNLDGFAHYVSDEEVRRSFINIGYQQVACIVNYFRTFKAICHTFSLPFTFDRIEKIANKFPFIIFNKVTYLKVYDVVPFKHEFFHRIVRAFPSLKNLCIMNYMPQSQIMNKSQCDDHELYSIIEYPHLTSLDVKCVNTDYIEQFLLETKAYLPCLIELKVNYDQLRTVTKDFTREETRRNCAKVKRLIIEEITMFPNEFGVYFPLL